MAPAAHQKIIIGSEVTTLAERRPIRCSQVRKIAPLPMHTAAASSSMPSEGTSRCSQSLAGVKKRSVQQRVERKQAEQQGGEFGKLQ